jgi:hypothetical protein
VVREGGKERVTKWQWYFWASSWVTFLAAVGLPTQLNRVRNVIGTLIVSIALGWLIWPVVLAAALRLGARRG